MDSLENLLAGYHKPDNSELHVIKQYIEETYHHTPGVAFSGSNIVITVQSAALANTLRLQVSKLKSLKTLS